MVRKSKWIQGTSPDEPVSRAARDALRARLRTVQYYLPLAAHKSDRDIEYVHQLRVATRRAVAAVSIFRPLLSTKKAAWLDKQLTRVRRAAGDARDYDVLCRRLDPWVHAQPTRPRVALLEQVQALREAAQRPILKAYAGLERGHFGRRAKKLLKRIRWRECGAARCEPSFAVAASQFLGDAVDSFFAAGACDPHDAAAVHRFRIIGKQLRYSMEVFAGAFDAQFRDSLYPLIEEVQEKLGEMNDHVTAIERFTAWQREWNDPRLDQPLAELLAAEQAALEQSRARVFAWWTHQRATELRSHFNVVLSARTAQREEKTA
jgi:CHAD domain-containing protein